MKEINTWNPRCARNNLWNLATLRQESTNLYSQQLGVNMELFFLLKVLDYVLIYEEGTLI